MTDHHVQIAGTDRGSGPTTLVDPRGATAARVAVDVVAFTATRRRLSVLLQPAAAGWCLPWDGLLSHEELGHAAGRIAADALGFAPDYLDQVTSLADERTHPGQADLSVGYLAIVARPRAPEVTGDAKWHAVTELPQLDQRHAALIEAAVDALRRRVDRQPLAFQLLPPTFTLTELQEVYELLLGRRLHKASFRRALQAAYLVEPTDEWRTEGRGRPAQLFRYAPRRRRGGRRGVRFELTVE